MLKHVDTRWISMFKPIERVFQQYKFLIGFSIKIEEVLIEPKIYYIT